MLKSMTGFGRGEGETTLGKLYVESRSVNHRYCDINVKLPKRLAPLENRIKEFIRSHVSRGRIDVLLKLEALGEVKVQLQVDLPLAEQYHLALQLLKERFQLKGEIDLALLAGAKDLITAKEETAEIDPYWQEIIPILKQSLQDMDEMKQLEGESIVKDFRQRLNHILQQLEMIKQHFPSHLEGYQKRLHDRLQSLIRGTDVDPSRFQQEIAFLAERTDITEEIVRTESHLAQVFSLLVSEEPIGRKAEFLVQEIHREVNTISAKANDAGTSQRVVEIKSELEKIREQVQNIE